MNVEFGVEVALFKAALVLCSAFRDSEVVPQASMGQLQACTIISRYAA